MLAAGSLRRGLVIEGLDGEVNVIGVIIKVSVPHLVVRGAIANGEHLDRATRHPRCAEVLCEVLLLLVIILHLLQGVDTSFIPESWVLYAKVTQKKEEQIKTNTRKQQIRAFFYMYKLPIDRLNSREVEPSVLPHLPR